MSDWWRLQDGRGKMLREVLSPPRSATISKKGFKRHENGLKKGKKERKAYVIHF